MNWKEHINLFANDKFQIRFDQDHVQYNLKGEVENLDAEMLFELERCGTDYTLIARQILDMSEEEMQKCIDLGSNPFEWDADRYREEMSFGFYDLSYEEFLYLLSIGVYPFDQKDFESGEVIARTEQS